MNAQVLDAIKRSAAVPSVPQVVTRFLEVIQDPNFDYEDLANLLSADPGMAGDLLRLTNSALFGVSRKITSLRRALTLLGPKRTRSLVLGRYLVESVGRTDIAGLNAAYFWRRSLVTAVLAARLARAQASRRQEDVFICGLLSDIGLPVLAQALPAEYKPIAARYAPNTAPFTDDDERAAVGVTHGEVSAMVLSYWGLPEPVCTAVNCHHARVSGDDAPSFAARLVGAGDAVARLLCETPDPDEVGRVCADVAAITGLSLADLGQAVTEIQDDVDELASVLHLDVLPDEAYTLVTQAIQEQDSATVGSQ